MSQIMIWKCRFSWVGSIGDCALSFDKITSRYISVDKMQSAEEMIAPDGYDRNKYKNPPRTWQKSYYEKDEIGRAHV